MKKRYFRWSILLYLGLMILPLGCSQGTSHVTVEQEKKVVIAVCGLSKVEVDSDNTTYKSPYLKILKRCDADFVLIPPETPPAEVRKIVASTDGLLLIGGGDIDPRRYEQAIHPADQIVLRERDETDFLAFELAERRNIPVLGICRGCQVINVARGGTLFQHLPDRTSLPHRLKKQAACHEVICERNLSMTHWPKSFRTNSYHHQAVDNPGKNLIVLARASDGTIEAIGDPAMRYLLGVQWHPELLADQAIHRQIYMDFVTACKK